MILGTRVRKTPTSSGKPNAKKVKKRNPWSDDESKSESDLEETEPVVIPRDSLLRRAAGIVIHLVFILLYSIVEYQLGSIVLSVTLENSITPKKDRVNNVFLRSILCI